MLSLHSLSEEGLISFKMLVADLAVPSPVTWASSGALSVPLLSGALWCLCEDLNAFSVALQCVDQLSYVSMVSILSFPSCPCVFSDVSARG